MRRIGPIEVIAALLALGFVATLATAGNKSKAEVMAIYEQCDDYADSKHPNSQGAFTIAAEACRNAKGVK
jgi:hypothetical protein